MNFNTLTTKPETLQDHPAPQAWPNMAACPKMERKKNLPLLLPF
jgi:hypothetical protein